MAVYDVVITAGQSNMTGMGNGTQTGDADPDLHFDWDGSSPFEQIDDPVSVSAPYKANTGSCVPVFANTFTQASGRPILIIRCAVGGTSLLAANAGTNGTWDTSGTLFDDSVDRTLDAITALGGLGHTVGHLVVIWSQGHRDAQGGEDLELYQAATSALVGRWRTALSAASLKVYMELLSSTSAASSSGEPEPNWALIRDAQLDACAETDGLEMAFTEGIEFAERGWMRNALDQVHYGQVGLNYMGLKLAQYAASDLGITLPPTPPLPASRSSVVARMLLASTPLPPLPASFITPGVVDWTVPDFTTALLAECEGGGGAGGHANAVLKGGAGGGGAYAKTNSISVTPGEVLRITVGAGGTVGAGDGGTGGTSQIVRLSDMSVLCKAVGGVGGIAATPAGDGAGGAAASGVGDVKTSGQAGGVSGIDNGGNGAAPLGGAGGTGPGPNAGVAPGGGGAGAAAGAAQNGGAGARGVVKLQVA